MKRLFRACMKCGFPVVKEKDRNIDYPFYCPHCDENLYSFETEKRAWVKIAEAEDYKKAYKDFCEFEDGFSEDVKIKMDFDSFVKELKKGYGKSGCIQIARLLETDHGIFYDNNYAG